MLREPLSKEENLERGIALEGIATAAEGLAKAGANPLEVQTFAAGAKRELARELGDIGQMQEAARLAKQYKELAKK